MKVLLALILFPCLSYAGPYYEVRNSTTAGTSTMTISGYIGVAASSTTPTTYKFRIDGPNGYIQFPDGTTQTSAGGGLASTQTFTGGNSLQGSTTFYGTINLPVRTKIIFGNEMTNSSSTVVATWNITQTSFFACVPGSTVTITTRGGSRVGVSYTGMVTNGIQGLYSVTGFKTDGVSWSGDKGLGGGQAPVADYRFSGSFYVVTPTLSAGSHSFCLDARVSTSNGYIIDDLNHTNQFVVWEIY